MSWKDWLAPTAAPESGSTLRISVPACLCGLAAVAYFFFSTRPFQIPYDDAYSTLEFARNMAATGRLTFDGLHTVAGTSSLLHVLLLAVPARLGIPLEIADVTLGVLFFVLLIDRTLAATMSLTKSWEASLYAGLLTALTGYLVLDALNGLETTLFMFLTVACLGSLMNSLGKGGGPWWPALWLYLAALTRPEGFWLAASLLFYLFVLAACRPGELRRFALLGAHLTGAILLALATQRLVTGSTMPHTALAKIYFFGEFRSPFRHRFELYTGLLQFLWQPLVLPLLPLFCARRARPLLLAVLPWIVVAQLMFLWLFPSGVSAYEGRYAHPAMPFLFILAGDGLAVLLDAARKYRIPRWPALVFLAFVCSTCYFHLVSMRAKFNNEKVAIRNNHFWAVSWLRAHAPRDIRIATHDIGVLRYFGDYDLFDIAGLVDEGAMARNRAGQGQLAYLIEKRPDYIVGDQLWLTRFAHYFPQLGRYVTTEAVAHPNAYGVVQLRIYRCHWGEPGKGPAPAGDASFH
jgi:hypothetical protein